MRGGGEGAETRGEPAGPGTGPGETHLYDPIVKVFVSAVERDFYSAWKTKNSVDCSGTAFAVPGSLVGMDEETLLVTNAHVVADASFIRIRRFGDSQKYVAHMRAISHECDLAVLSVEEGFFESSQSFFEFADDLPQLQDEVHVVGYPTGGDSVSVTRGVVSRIEAVQYVQSGKSLLAIQVDAPINPGNSGGPCLSFSAEKGSQLVGVAFQGLSGDTDGIGYIIPARILSRFLEGIRRSGTVMPFLSLGIMFQKLESKALREYFGVDSHGEGVLITNVDPMSASAGVLHKDDILIKVGGKQLGVDGTIQLRGKGERVSFATIPQQLFEGDALPLLVWRNRSLVEVNVTLKRFPEFVQSTRNEQPRYLVFCGLVFSVLSHPYFSDAYDLGEMALGQETRRDLKLFVKANSKRKKENEEIVFLSRVLADSATQGYASWKHLTLTTFQGVPVANLRQLHELIEADHASKYFLFEFGSQRLILDAAIARERHPIILERHLIATEYYLGQ